MASRQFKILGMSFGEWLPYLLIGGIFLLLLTLGKTASSIVGSAIDGVKGLFGKGKAQSENQDLIFKRLADNAGVKSQINTENGRKAEMLFNAMNGMGTDENKIFDVFKTITGPNQFGAIYYMYGLRTLSLVPWFANFIPVVGITSLSNMTGKDLIECLTDELSASDLKKIQSVLDYIKQF